MARRMVLGNSDFRISRPGFDAATGNVNDRTQISFALSRDVMGRTASAGTIAAVNSAVAFSEVFPAPPPVILGQLKSGHMMIDDFLRSAPNGVADTVAWQDATTFVAVVTNANILVTTPLIGPGGAPAADAFIYMAVA